MKGLRFSVWPLLILIMAGISRGQELSNYYTPYGFRLPCLDKGEYSISLGTYYLKYKSRYDDPDSDFDRQSRSKNSALTLDGLYGISKNLLFRGSVSFYPSLTSSESDSYFLNPISGDVLYYKFKSDLHSYISPSATIVFRPNPKIEIFADYSTYISNRDQFEISDSAATLQEKLKMEYHYIWIGINFIGKL